MKGVLEAVSSLAAELGISLSDGRVWLAFGTALIVGAICALVGIWIARRVGLLAPSAPAGESVSVGLGTGLLVIAAGWAALFSGGRSSFTVVAVAFAVAILLPVPYRRGSAGSPDDVAVPSERTLISAGPLAVLMVAAAAFVVLMGLLYGATLAPSPRDGMQPIEFFDAAYYSVLGADLARTGTESIYSPSGFEELPGLSVQTWYHWGELWLAAAVIAIFDTDPIVARHYVVLPLVLLAAAGLTGTIVRRLTRTHSRAAFGFGVAACVGLAPLPMPLPGLFFTKWATGLIFGITHYGLGAVVALLALYIVCVRGQLGRSLGLSLLTGAVLASLLPAHIVLATLATVAVAGGGGLFLAQEVVVRGRVTWMSSAWRDTLAAATSIGLLTLVWALLTGHQLGASGPSASIASFNAAWLTSILWNTFGSGILLSIPIVFFVERRHLPLLSWICLGTTVMLIAGATAWGARLADFNMFHAFFGGVAVLGAPVAAAAVVALWRHARARGHMGIAAAVFVVCGVHVGLGVIAGVARLHAVGSPDYRPVPSSLLTAIAQLPEHAKLAYACHSVEEPAFWDPALTSITAHTGRTVVTMCFQADVFTSLVTGTDSSLEAMNPLFNFAPQRVLYPTSTAQPSQSEIVAFLRHHEVNYIFTDADHPNVLLPEAVPIAAGGGAQVLRVP